MPYFIVIPSCRCLESRCSPSSLIFCTLLICKLALRSSTSRATCKCFLELAHIGLVALRFVFCFRCQDCPHIHIEGLQDLGDVAIAVFLTHQLENYVATRVLVANLDCVVYFIFCKLFDRVQQRS